MKYYIWSFEHVAFWAPNHRGYTSDIRYAGKYTEGEAFDVVDQARGDEVALRVSGPESGPDVIVFAADAVRACVLPDVDAS